MPILFSGTNRYHNLVLGSLVYENDDEGYYRFFHVIADDSTYYDFLHQKISYRQVLKDANSFYVVDKDYENKVRNIYHFEFDEIPQEYVPLEDSFCPEPEYKYSLFFILGLKGKLADMKRAIPSEISLIQTKFSSLLESSIKSLKGMNLVPSIYQEVYTEGSFRLNFNVDLQDQQLFPQDEALISRYITKYFGYCLSDVHDEIEFIFKDNMESAVKFKKLTDEFKILYQSSQVKVPADYENIIKDEIKSSIESFDEITDKIGTHFTGIELINKAEGVENRLGYVDTLRKTVLGETVQVIDSLVPTEEDKEPQDYKIWIYHLNTKSRTGNAYIYNVGSDKEMSHPKIKIEGEDPLEGTKYTESLHLNKWIDVSAKAKRFGEKFKYLSIVYNA
ncbi:MAG: hypothetical protein ACOYU2_10490 [Nitrospirota bacterium]